MTNKIATSIVNKKLCAQKLVKVAHEAATVPSIFGAGDLLGGLKLGDPQTPSAAEGQAWADLQKSWRDKGLPEANFDWSKQPELARILARNSAGMPALPPAQSPLTPAQYAQKIPDKRIPEIKATSDPRSAPPAPAAKAPALNFDYRGKGGLGELSWTPDRAPYMKTWEQLNTEQGISPGDTKPRYSIMDSAGAALLGGGGAVSGAVGNIGGAAATPVGWLVDGVGGLFGANPKWTENIGNFRVVSQDLRDRGLHQMLHNTRSRALDDRQATNDAIVAENLKPGLLKSTYNFVDGAYDAGRGAAPYALLKTPAGMIGGHYMAAGADRLTGLPDPRQVEQAELTSNNGELSATLPGVGTLPISELSPDNANFVAQRNPAVLDAHLQAGGQLPQNLMTPEERTMSGVPGANTQNEPPVQPAAETDPLSTTEGFNARFSQLSPDELARAETLVNQVEGGQIDHDTFQTELRKIMAPQPAQPVAPEQKPAPRRPFDDDPTDSAVVNNAAPEQTSPTGQQAAPAPIPGLPADASPEVVQQAEQSRAAVSENPIAKPAISDPNSPERQQALDTGRQTLEQQLAPDYMKTNPPPQGPQDFGEWLNGMTSYMGEMWESLGPMGKLAVGLGVPLGLIGLMGDGIGSFLMSAVGLGAAGTALASAGVFGDTAQQGVNSVLGGVMPNATEIQTAATAPAQAAAPGGTNAAGNTTASGQTAAIKPLNSALSENELSSLSDAQRTAINNAQANPQKFKQDARKAVMTTSSGLPGGDFGQFLQLPPDTMRKLYQSLPPAEQKEIIDGLIQAEQITLRNKEMDTALQNAIAVLTKKAATMFTDKIATQIVQNKLTCFAALKTARCWKGYEPVPGKKPYTNGSCRPQGSKKKKQMKKKSSDTYALTQLPALLNTIRGYYVKQAYTQSTQIRPQSRPQTGA